jgi:hypothetical protein
VGNLEDQAWHSVQAMLPLRTLDRQHSEGDQPPFICKFGKVSYARKLYRVAAIYVYMSKGSKDVITLLVPADMKVGDICVNSATSVHLTRLRKVIPLSGGEEGDEKVNPELAAALVSKVDKPFVSEKFTRPPMDNMGMCAICGDGGSLLLCDDCPHAFHFECLMLDEEDVGDTWSCSEAGKPCSTKAKSTLERMALKKRKRLEEEALSLMDQDALGDEEKKQKNGPPAAKKRRTRGGGSKGKVAGQCSPARGQGQDGAAHEVGGSSSQLTALMSQLAGVVAAFKDLKPAPNQAPTAASAGSGNATTTMYDIARLLQSVVDAKKPAADAKSGSAKRSAAASEVAVANHRGCANTNPTTTRYCLQRRFLYHFPNIFSVFYCFSERQPISSRNVPLPCCGFSQTQLACGTHECRNRRRCSSG